MNSSSVKLLAADLVLSLHIAFVAFIVLGLVLIIVGAFRSWYWVRNPWFRSVHLIGTIVVAAQACLGIVCPLTTLEIGLRNSAATTTYAGTFISHWMQQLLYISAPEWVFAAVYSAFALLVAVSWVAVRPRSF